ncbi:hypothetical protein [Brevundimonas variabilis]|uniref:Lipoprotein n=1 Tax=Brevundimonas variabilis TaxID=74312 RepID=A0A7W9CIV8_9CAUL|nr:hypothetical protein [Brevundimonas variabilis]MBB5746484.1 hypothetical protein [Brevundimonas variabilis]
MTRPDLALGLLLSTALLAACGQEAAVNSPTEPAPAIETPAMATPGVDSGIAGSGAMPGTGPTSFVGRWSRDVSWCADPAGNPRTLAITPVQFAGDGQRCEIASIDQAVNGYDANLQCQTGTGPRTERVSMTVAGQVLTLTWLDRQDDPVTLTKCTTLGDNSTKAPALPVP